MYDALAPLYDRIFGDESFYRRYGRFVRRICRERGLRPRRVLDVACGTGRLAKYLPGDVYGIDASPAMLRIAAGRLHARRGFMTRFRVSSPFDLILCTFDSLNHLTQRQLGPAFACVRRALAPRGLYIFDVSSDFRIRQICPAFLGRRFRVRRCEVFWISRSRPGKWESRITVFEPRGRLWKRSEERIVEHAFTLGRIRSSLRRSGLRTLGEYGTLRGEPIQPTSERWYFVAGHGPGH